MWWLILWACSTEIGTPLSVNQKLEIYPYSKMDVARDGSVLILTPKALHHWDSEGRPLLTIDQVDGRPFQFIGTFHYDPKAGVYWLIDSIAQRSYLFDRSGEHIGRAYEISEQGEQVEVYFRDLISVGSRIFAIGGRLLDPWSTADENMVQQVTYYLDPENPNSVLVRRIGGAFGKITDLQREYQFNFKRYWMVQDGFSKNFFLVNEIATSMQRYTGNANTNGIDDLEPVGNPILLYMPGWVSRPSRKSGMPRPNPSNFYDFSIITGLYEMDEDLLVAYIIPTDEDYTLTAMQRLAKDGVIRGESITRKGLVVGVHQSDVYLLQWDPTEEKPCYRIEKIRMP